MRTAADLPVSRETYTEIASKLRDAAYTYALRPDGRLDMHGIALVRDPQLDSGLHGWRAEVVLFLLVVVPAGVMLGLHWAMLGAGAYLIGRCARALR